MAKESFLRRKLIGWLYASLNDVEKYEVRGDLRCSSIEEVVAEKFRQWDALFGRLIVPRGEDGSVVLEHARKDRIGRQLTNLVRCLLLLLSGPWVDPEGRWPTGTGQQNAKAETNNQDRKTFRCLIAFHCRGC